MNTTDPEPEAMADFRNKIFRMLYPLIAVLVLLWMFINTSLAGHILYVLLSGIIEPDWYDEVRMYFSLSATLLNSEDSDAGKALGALAIAIGSILLGIFLRRTQGSKHKFELAGVFLLLLLAIVQIVAILLLPDRNDANLQLVGGTVLLANLESALNQSSSVALIICGSALGTNFQTKPE